VGWNRVLPSWRGRWHDNRMAPATGWRCCQSYVLVSILRVELRRIWADEQWSLLYVIHPTSRLLSLGRSDICAPNTASRKARPLKNRLVESRTIVSIVAATIGTIVRP
jgi:hypothetical protein